MQGVDDGEDDEGEVGEEKQYGTRPDADSAIFQSGGEMTKQKGSSVATIPQFCGSLRPIDF